MLRRGRAQGSMHVHGDFALKGIDAPSSLTVSLSDMVGDKGLRSGPCRCFRVLQDSLEERTAG